MFINTIDILYDYHKIYLKPFSECYTRLGIATQAALSCSAGCIYALLNANSFIFLYIYILCDGWVTCTLLAEAHRALTICALNLHGYLGETLLA